MQTKPYRLLKWTLLACLTASLASACVVTTGDGDDFDDFDDNGGEGGTSNNSAGKSSGGGGSSSTAGKAGSATGGGGSSSTAGTSSGGSAGSGGSAPAYEGGLCDSDVPVEQESGPTPTVPADATLNADDDLPGNACRKCLKTECETEWSTCYGTEPRIACGWGPDNATEDGQFDCFLKCFDAGAADPMGTADDLIAECGEQCTNQCDGDGGNVMIHTNDLISCANDPEKCQEDCLPF